MAMSAPSAAVVAFDPPGLVASTGTTGVPLRVNLKSASWIVVPLRSFSGVNRTYLVLTAPPVTERTSTEAVADPPAEVAVRVKVVSALSGGSIAVVPATGLTDPTPWSMEAESVRSSDHETLAVSPSATTMPVGVKLRISGSTVAGTLNA